MYNLDNGDHCSILHYISCSKHPGCLCSLHLQQPENNQRLQTGKENNNYSRLNSSISFYLKFQRIELVRILHYLSAHNKVMEGLQPPFHMWKSRITTDTTPQAEPQESQRTLSAP